MLPLTDWPTAARRNTIGVFTDIDDTLTTQGAITPDALQALADLQAVGLPVVAITGRSVAWCEAFAQAWPVTAIVAENGAVAWVNGNSVAHAVPAEMAAKTAKKMADFQSKKGLRSAPTVRRALSKIYQSDVATRSSNYALLQAAAQQVLREVPSARLAQDSAGRETDIAIDHSEFNHMPPADVAQSQRLLQAAGLQATVSSIHVNAWLGAHNKLQGAHWIVRQLWGRELAAELERWAYVGDSSNDELMFQAFAQSVGVANIARFLPGLKSKPRYLAQGERGAGFAQVVQALLDAQA